MTLGSRLREYRVQNGLTQDEVARAIGIANASAISQWETGVTVPDGLPRDRLVDMLDGRLWQRFREARMETKGMPGRWNEAARWYRRASREREYRETIGVILATLLQRLREVDSLEALRQRYCAENESVRALAVELVSVPMLDKDVLRAEDSAYGLRWLEITCGLELDPHRSLVRDVPSSLLDQAVENRTRPPRLAAVRRDR